MSMGHDDDDPRREFYRQQFDERAYQLKPGQKPTVDRYKRPARGGYSLTWTGKS